MLRISILASVLTPVLLTLAANAFAESSWYDIIRFNVRTSIVNTTGNTYPTGSGWESSMGPLTPQFGGIACDQVASQNGDARKYRNGDYALWFVAPSDLIPQMGMTRCSANPYGGEPSCMENWHFCGRKIRVRCQAGARWCAPAGQTSLLSQIVQGQRPANNYIPEYYVDKTREAVGGGAAVPSSVVLYVTDFCPSGHSVNARTGQCQGPQLDISTPAFLLLARQNEQGYIDSNLELDAELLPDGDGTPIGPQYGEGSDSGAFPNFPKCSNTSSDPDGDGWGWENGVSCHV